MKSYAVTHLVIFAGLLVFSSGVFAGDRTYTAKNGVFTVNYPNQIKTKVRSKQQKGFLSVDFIEKSKQLPSYAKTIYAIEWAQAEKETEENFLNKWKKFIPTYFAQNFGPKAKIELVKLKPVIQINAHKGYEYVGQGLLNDEKTFGNINVVTFKTKKAICTIYQISVIAEEKQKAPFSEGNVQYKRFQEFVASFKVNDEKI